jgi:thiamine-monophosphate kinase
MVQRHDPEPGGTRTRGPNAADREDPALTALGEFGLIARIRRRTRIRSAGAVVGIGDDAALLAVEAGDRLLVTADMLLDGVHFQWGWGCFRELGRKAVAVNVSDIAAMGGRPGYALLGLGIPSAGVTLDALDALLAGMEEEAEAHGVSLVGGDTCASRGGLVLSLTLIGFASPAGPVLRSGAKPGDGLWVTGTLGGAAAGLLALEEGFRPGAPWPERLARPAWAGTAEEAAIHAALAGHLTPVPRVAAGQALVGRATAMIDVSDGIASDAGHLATEGRVGVRVEARQVPIHAGARVVGRLAGRDPLDLALRGGEDYELLFTAAADPGPVLAAVAPGLAVTRIGEVTAEMGVALLDHGDGRVEPLGGGFDHLRVGH